VVPWERSREYFFHRVRRRLAQDALVKTLKASDAALTHTDAVALLRGWVGEVDWEDDKAMLAALEAPELEANLEGVAVAAAKKSVTDIIAGLSEEQKAELLSSL